MVTDGEYLPLDRFGQLRPRRNDGCQVGVRLECSPFRSALRAVVGSARVFGGSSRTVLSASRFRGFAPVAAQALESSRACIFFADYCDRPRAEDAISTGPQRRVGNRATSVLWDRIVRWLICFESRSTDRARRPRQVLDFFQSCRPSHER